MFRPLVLLAFAVSTLPAQTVDLNVYAEMHWRQIGPPRAGRARALAGVPSQPNVFYIGFDNGGVWRSNDYGSTWKPLFDNQPTGSVGGIAVSPSNPNIIYVGSGAGIIRPDLATGDGMYKSTDAGKTWTHLGLRDSQMIASVEVDPRNPDRLFVAALGHPYGPNTERGIFRSTDGGASFQKVLYKDEYTSANDVRIDPNDPNIVYAALWQQQQGFYENGVFGGTDGGIFKSTDGGTTWKPLKMGLLQANLAIAPSDSRIVYAMVATPSATAGGRRPGGGTVSFLKSSDGGVTWNTAGTDPRPARPHWRWRSANHYCRSQKIRKWSIAARPSSGEPMTAARTGPPYAAHPAVTITRKAGLTRKTLIFCSLSPIRAASCPPTMANPGAIGTTNPRPPSITSPPTTPSPTGSAAVSRTPVPPASTAAVWMAKSPSTTGTP